MSKIKHTRRIFISWLLLAVFTLPIMIKSFHVCQYDNGTEVPTSKATGHHASGHNPDKCLICQFAFPTFGIADTIAIAAIVSVLMGTVVSVCVQNVVRRVAEVISLRAPPCTM